MYDQCDKRILEEKEREALLSEGKVRLGHTSPIPPRTMNDMPPPSISRAEEMDSAIVRVDEFREQLLYFLQQINGDREAKNPNEPVKQPTPSLRDVLFEGPSQIHRSLDEANQIVYEIKKIVLGDF